MLSPLEERFWAKVQKTDTCWVWTKIDALGQGRLYPPSNNKYIAAHHYSYELHKGPIEQGKLIIQTCGVRHCVNPEHLDKLTRAEYFQLRKKREALNAGESAVL